MIILLFSNLVNCENEEGDNTSNSQFFITALIAYFFENFRFASDRLVCFKLRYFQDFEKVFRRC